MPGRIASDALNSPTAGRSLPGRKLGTVPESPLAGEAIASTGMGEIERLGSSRSLWFDVRVISATKYRSPGSMHNVNFAEDHPSMLKHSRDSRRSAAGARGGYSQLAIHFLRRYASRPSRHSAGSTSAFATWPGNAP